ncbi:hypothetical protein FALBO_10203 [Fusarium albosuccineum]|uniref:Uncharacterized protein n=1 Tax=Fusarium albosuccineum TaxID=1237068 RepID=A0A8H4PB97_9HYPO|nr:hypothetical protein FALBO_10203 [Fusarium albosuccineum]
MILFNYPIHLIYLLIPIYLTHCVHKFLVAEFIQNHGIKICQFRIPARLPAVNLMIPDLAEKSLDLGLFNLIPVDARLFSLKLEMDLAGSFQRRQEYFCGFANSLGIRRVQKFIEGHRAGDHAWISIVSMG